MRPAIPQLGARRSRPSRAGDADPAAIEAEVAGLEALAIEDLRGIWKRLHHTEPPTRLSRDLLIRGVAYKLQEQAYGGLSSTTARRLRSLTIEQSKGNGSPLPPPALRPGTRLVREWHGRTHNVIVVGDGFDYDGERYRSLSEIARRITGSHRSGPFFFGLRRPPSSAPPELNADYE